MPTGETHTCTGGAEPVAVGVDLAPAREIIERHAGDPGALIAVLQRAQDAYGCLPEAVIEEVARARGVPLAAVYGVVTFFAQLRLKPHGRTEVRVCHGTACYVGGAVHVTEAVADELGVAEGGTTTDGEFTLESVACLGCCGLAPVMMIGEQAYGRLTQETAREAVRHRAREAEEERDEGAASDEGAE